MIFITGDTHGTFDLVETVEYFENKKNVTKSDYLIICGDVGVCWNGVNQRVVEMLHNLSCTVLFCEGNHENFDLLFSYPVSEWHGGKVHFITEDIIHLMRGEVFDIDGLKFFTFGGALSTDKCEALAHKGWWEQEQPTEVELQNGITNLEKCDYKVDYVISHTAPKSIVRQLDKKADVDILQDYFEELIPKLDFKMWYFGHWHKNKKVNDKFRCLFLNVVKIY